jgi:hypothetical protein
VILPFQGLIIGPEVCSALKSKLGNKVGCQGIGGAYTASMTDNAKPAYTTQEAINEAIKMFKLAGSKCPNTKITFGGYRYVSHYPFTTPSSLPLLILSTQTHIPLCAI